MCICVSDEILPCARYTHFQEKTFFNDLILPPPFQLIVRQPRWSLIISLSLTHYPPPHTLLAPLSSLLVNLLQIDFVICLIPYRLLRVADVLVLQRGLPENEMRGEGEQRDGEVHRHRTVKCDGGG